MKKLTNIFPRILALIYWINGKARSPYCQGKFLRVLGHIDQLGNLVNEYPRKPIINHWQSEYQLRRIWDPEDIHLFLTAVFSISNISSIIHDHFGETFYVSYFSDYQNFGGSEPAGTYGYAEQLHIDKCFPSGTLKVAVLMEDITESHGPLEILTGGERFTLVGPAGSCMIFDPTGVSHSAGIPEPGLSRRQLMITLLPSDTYHISTQIYERQFSREPKYLINHS